MERRNFFEMLNLDFDPPEKNQRRIEKAISDWKKRTQDMLANETVESYREVLTRELSYYDEMVAVFSDNKLKNLEARALKEFRVNQLRQLIDIMLMGLGGTPEVTRAQIHNIHLKLRISPKTIEDIYKEKGFVIQKPNKLVNLDDYFLTGVVYGHIKTNLKKLSVTSSSKYPWVNKIHDMYDLACFFSGGEIKDKNIYHKKRTSELFAIMESWAAQLASDMSFEGHLLGDLFTAGMTQVFDCETNRKKYDRSLEREELSGFFSLLKAAPEEFKKDRYFAESCIRKIQNSFSDYTLALALYNQEAGLLKNPYEPLEALIHVVCASCKTPAEFRTREEARRSRCAVCGAELYIECPVCHNAVPAVADRCSCGFCVSEMMFFDEYVKASENALNEMNLVEARKQFAKAQNAYPGHHRLKALQQRITAETEKYQKPIDTLQEALETGMYCKAMELMTSLSVTMPHLRFDTQRKIASDKINEAKRAMPSSSSSDEEKADRCVEVLQIVKDYQPAIDILSHIKPRAPRNLSGSVSGEGGSIVCTLTWESSGDNGVRYRVVRKSNGVPSSYSDGEILSQNVRGLSYSDNTLQSGVDYGYAVFAYRAGSFSSPAYYQASVFSDLNSKQFSAKSANGVCKFSWVLPRNCIGVRILRSENNIPSEEPGLNCSIVTAKAFTYFDDTTVKNNITYGYRLQCIYPHDKSFRYSPGITVMLTPESPPEILSNISASTAGKTVTLKWDRPKNPKTVVMVREAPDLGIERQKNIVMDAAEMNALVGRGRLYSHISGKAMTLQFNIPENTQHTLAIISISGSKGIISDVIKVSSVEKCEINRRETVVDANRLKLKLMSVPDNLERIYYIAAVKTDQTVPWASIDDAKNKSIPSVSVNDYLHDGLILIENLPHKEMYVSVIGQYRMSDGTVSYSEPSKIRINNKPKEKITYRFNWSGIGLLSRIKERGCTLTVLSDAEYTPEIFVVYKTDGHIPMKLGDPKTVIIHTIEESDSGFENGEYTYRFPDEIVSKLKSGLQLRCLISVDDMSEYDITPMDIAACRTP